MRSRVFLLLIVGCVVLMISSCIPTASGPVVFDGHVGMSKDFLGMYEKKADDSSEYLLISLSLIGDRFHADGWDDGKSKKMEGDFIPSMVPGMKDVFVFYFPTFKCEEDVINAFFLIRFEKDVMEVWVTKTEDQLDNTDASSSSLERLKTYIKTEAGNIMETETPVFRFNRIAS